MAGEDEKPGSYSPIAKSCEVVQKEEQSIACTILGSVYILCIIDV